MTTEQWLTSASAALARAGIPSARLDAEIILADVLGCDRSYLHAHSDTVLDVSTLSVANKHLARRRRHEPLAYIRGFKEFYGRNFAVRPDVLIPRPETEAVIEVFNELPLQPGAHVADIGTGSGAIAITLKLEYPELSVVATDVSQAALEVAARNAATLEADIEMWRGSLLEPLEDRQQAARPLEQHLRSPQTEALFAPKAIVREDAQLIDAIIANLPYVDRSWERSPGTNFEPAQALFADNDGLALIYKLVITAPAHLTDRGFLLLEADPEQHLRIIDKAQANGFKHLETNGYCLAFQKI